MAGATIGKNTLNHASSRNFVAHVCYDEQALQYWSQNAKFDETIIVDVWILKPKFIKSFFVPKENIKSFNRLA